MSLIMDAQKAAQREKDRRAAGAATGNAPLLVPLRSKAVSQVSWQKPLLLAGAVAGAVAAGWFLFQSRDSVPRALRTPGPTIASIAAPPAAKASPPDVSADKEIARVTNPVVDSSRSAPRGNAATAVPPKRVARAVTAQTRPSRAMSERPPATGTGRLVIEVDQPRAAEVARLLAAGVAAHRAGDAAAARAAYEQVLAISPNDVDALNNLGVLHTGLRELDRAEALLRRAIALAPSNAGAWSNLAAVLRERGKPTEAIAAFQRALSIDAHHAGARVGLAQQYLVIGSLTQARALLEGVLRDNPASPEASYALGQVLERQGDRAGAVRAYSTFVQNAPPALAVYVESVRLRIEALTPRTP
ncbi:MAG TPA: tetratricopeptide repeat protein [Gemmatimonadaceae bacterium]